MKKFIYYPQLDKMDCGPSCLRMIAKFYNRSFSLQSLRDRTQIGKDGVSLLSISEAAESIGFRTSGKKLTLTDLIKEAPLPCIVHWKKNHFVVVYDIKINKPTWVSRKMSGKEKTLPVQSIVDEYENLDPSLNISDETSPWMKFQSKNEIITEVLPSGKVYVADPSKGLITLTIEDFMRGWIGSKYSIVNTGVVLLLEPTPTFYNQINEKIDTYDFKRVLGYFSQYNRLLVQLILGLFVGSGLQLIFPFLTQSVVDIGISTQNISFIYLVLIAQLMLMVGRLSVEFIRSWILLHISTRINLAIISDFLIKLMRLPLSFFDTKHFGDLMQRINDHHRVESFLTGNSLSVLFSLINLVIFGVVLAIFNLSIFLIFLLSSLLYCIWVALFLKRRRQLDFKRFEILSQSQSGLVQMIQGMQDIKLSSSERQTRWKWESIQAKSAKLQMKGLELSQYQQVGAFAINEGKNILITFLSAYAVINGSLSLGSMLAMQQIVGQLNSPIEQLISFLQGMQDAKISLERINEIHTLKEEMVDNESGTNELPRDKDIVLENVSYKYNGTGNDFVLKDISFSIFSGKTTAIVGTSGSGKSTLLKLLLRFYEPSLGQIRLGDLLLNKIDHSTWRQNCGVVMQDGFIFSDTIANNISVGFETIDYKRLNEAIKTARLSEFIDALPAGYNTLIGQEGNGISYGQRQRILIARAVYKDPQIILFDEATNSLDSNTEVEIMSNLTDFFRGRTVIIVAHRLSTVHNADQIIVMEKGRISSTGTHNDLILKKGAYWELVRNQLALDS